MKQFVLTRFTEIRRDQALKILSPLVILTMEGTVVAKFVLTRCTGIRDRALKILKSSSDFNYRKDNGCQGH